MKRHQIKQAVFLLVVSAVFSISSFTASAQRGGGHHLGSFSGSGHSSHSSFGGGFSSGGFHGSQSVYHGGNVGYHGGNNVYARASYYPRGYGYSRAYYPNYGFYPSIGFRVGFLPYGYYNFWLGNSWCYYYNDVYYRRVADDNYEVIAPPLGAKIPQLPSHAKAVMIDGKQYYECEGTYYREELNANNQVLYTVVGVNGVLNQQGGGGQQQQIYVEPQIGDIVPQLPSDCKPVYLNGQQYFLSSANVFYQQVTDGNNTAYKIVGK
ncbi:DUF6515 family protein [Parasediminibacterium sp. JCM 36343]|uniref:DUF6515 family protein n=1 Tax=Parasediminibacterium sp. JCM 36343 TaxID=3374279 RepID=UPI0039797C28